MKALRFLLSIVIIVAAFAASAMAQGGDVYLTIDSGTQTLYYLDNMSVAADGTITLSVSSGGSNLALSCSPPSFPGGTVNVAYSQSMTMTALGGTPPYSSYSCTGTGPAGLTTTLSGTICTVSGTPTTNGTYTVSMGVKDSTNASASHNMSFAIYPVGGGGGNGSDPSSAISLNYNDPNTNWQTFPMAAGSTKYFKAVQVSQCTSGYKQLKFDIIYQQTAPNLDFIVMKTNGGPVPPPFYDAYQQKLLQTGYDGLNHNDGTYFWRFVGTQSGSGESTYVPSTFTQADTYYILVVNTNASKSTTFDMRYYCR